VLLTTALDGEESRFRSSIICGPQVTLVRDLQSHGFGQLRLPLVESPESFRFEFQGAGDVETAQRPDAELRAVAAGEVGAQIEGVLRHWQ
jgi:hypothetical protein